MNESGDDSSSEIIEVDEFFDLKQEVLMENDSDVEIIEESDEDLMVVHSPSAVRAAAQSTSANVNGVNITNTEDIPDCWTQDQCDNFKRLHKWLVIKNGKLGCRPCMKMFQIQMSSTDDDAADITKGLGRSVIGWRTCQVISNARTNATHQAALRGKISVHERSRYHMTALASEEKTEKFTLRDRLLKFKNALDPSSLLSVFNLAYNVIKCKQPFECFSQMCSFNGSQNYFDGSSLTPEKLFHSIVRHVATELRKSLVRRMLSRNDQKISIVMHEARFTNGGKMLIVVHLKFHGVNFDKPRTSDAYVFFDMLSVNSRSADEAIVSLIDCLRTFNVTKEYLRANLVSFIFDENSSLLGLSSNVSVTLSRQVLLFPNAKIDYDFDHTFKDTIRNSYDNIKRKLKCSSMFNTSAMADAMFICMVGPSVDQFKAADVMNNWLKSGILEDLLKNGPKKRQLVDKPTEKISIDMALAAEAPDEQRLVIDLKSESNSNSHQGSDDVEDSSTITRRDNEDNTGDNGECNVKRKKRSWRQMDTKQNCESADDNDIVEKAAQRVKGSSDSSCASCNEDNDRLFLLSLLPFMKQMNTRVNLEFRTEVQQLLQKKIAFK